MIVWATASLKSDEPAGDHNRTAELEVPDGATDEQITDLVNEWFDKVTRVTWSKPKRGNQEDRG